MTINFTAGGGVVLPARDVIALVPGGGGGGQGAGFLFLLGEGWITKAIKVVKGGHTKKIR